MVLRSVEEVGPLVEGRVYAAVAMILGPGAGGGRELLMIRRADREGDPWSGHMGFPGGHREAHDPDLLGTAIREVGEEIGLELPRDRCIGALGELSPVSRRREIWVRPFVFRLDHWPELQPSHEVAAVHRFDFQRIVAGEGRGTFQYPWQGVEWEFPCVRLDGELIWGLSLRMIDDLLERGEG